jgi:nucleotide-binding universal stress UspA family protein
MTTPAADPLILCYDGSADAGHAIEQAGKFFPGRHALVLTVWQPIAAMGTFAWTGATVGAIDFAELDHEAAQDGGRMAEEGVRIARAAGLDAEPVAVQATGPVWKTIIETADRRQAALIVIGSRGLTGLRSMLLGSVSSAVVHHGSRPTLVIHRHSDDAAAE